MLPLGTCTDTLQKMNGCFNPVLVTSVSSGGSRGGGGGGGGGFRGLQPPQKLRAIHTKCATNTVLSMQTHRFTQQWAWW